MSAPTGQSAPAKSTTTAAALPPWMLLLLIGFAVSVPATAQYWRQYIADLTGGGAYSADVISRPSFVLLRLDAMVQFVPTVVMVIGLLAVALPRVRAVIVERRLGLTEQRRPVIIQIEDFLREHGATVEVRCNLVRQDRLARIYPAGWRRARLAVFGPFVALWRRDQPAAQAVLLHEVAHMRTGDQLFLGLGSPFVALANLWFPLLTVFGVLPLAGFALVQYPTAQTLSAQLLLLLTQLPRTLLLPVAALWLAELAADRYVIDCGFQAELLRALDTQDRHGGRYLRALTHLSHPPRALRLWAIRGGPSRDVTLLASWPLLVLAQLLIILTSAIPAWFLAGLPGQQIIEAAVHNSGAFLADSARIWGPAAVLLLIWPVVARPWTRWWAGRAAGHSRMPNRTYTTAALLVTIILLPLFLLIP
jgi:hypothetical protein